MAAVSSQPAGCRWLYLPLELTLENYKDVFCSEILPAVKPEWQPQELDYHIFESGVTNTLVAFYQRRLGLQNSGKDVILLRVDGVGTESIINRTDEVVTLISLGQIGLCSPLYAQLNNGLCYGYAPGRRLKLHETSSNPLIMRKIARSMAKLHSMEMPRHFVDREPFLWMKIKDFMKSVPSSFSNGDNMQDVFIASIGSIEKLQEEIEFTRDLILKKCNSPVVFCHNDIHSANIIYNEETDDITLIDYEYAGPNYSAHDIANHFCEFAGVEEVDYQRYPDETVQKMWIRMYLEEIQKVKDNTGVLPIEEMVVHNLYLEVNTFVLGCHLLWIVWALFQAANSNIDFDFMAYGALRYKEYFKRKALLATL